MTQRVAIATMGYAMADHCRRVTDLGLNHGTVRRLAVEASVDPRSVVRELRAAIGQMTPVRGMAGDRVRRVLIRHGYLPRKQQP